MEWFLFLFLFLIYVVGEFLSFLDEVLVKDLDDSKVGKFGRFVIVTNIGLFEMSLVNGCLR